MIQVQVYIYYVTIKVDVCYLLLQLGGQHKDWGYELHIEGLGFLQKISLYREKRRDKKVMEKGSIL